MKAMVAVAVLALALSACTAVRSWDWRAGAMRVPGAPRPLGPGEALETSSGSVMGIHEMAEALGRVRLVFVGETHTRKEDHDLQLRLIRLLHAQGGDLILGLEMFQRPYQQALDDYGHGRLDEDGLQRAVDWPTTWGYPFDLYAPILRYARDHGIPLLALNAPAALVRKVARVGIEGLTQEEKAALPSPWPRTSEAYRELLRDQFQTHAHAGLHAFERFVESQLLWDATMAQTLAERIGAHGDPAAVRAVVLAGRGHTGRGTGIPAAFVDRLPLPYGVVMPVAEEELEGLDPSWADFIVPVFPREEPKAPTQLDQSGR
jgi:uncharacterized iron-regulated protein